MNKLLSVIALSTLVLSASSVYAGEQIGFSKANLKMTDKGARPAVEIRECSQLSAEEQKKSKLCTQLCEKGNKTFYKGKYHRFYPAHCGPEPEHDSFYELNDK